MLPSEGVVIDDDDDDDDDDGIAETWCDALDRASNRCCGLQKKHKGFRLVNNSLTKPPAKQGQCKWQCAGGNREQHYNADPTDNTKRTWMKYCKNSCC